MSQATHRIKGPSVGSQPAPAADLCTDPDASGWKLTRRQWIAGATVATAAMIDPATRAADDPPKAPWIDAHSHIWTRDVERFPLAKGKSLEDLAPPSFTTEELLETARAHDVGRVVLIQHHPYHGWDNSYVIDAARRHPGVFRVVAMVDNFSAHPGRQMNDLLQNHVTGFRITSQIHQQQWLAGGMDEMWQTAARTRQNICCLINPDEIAQIDAMCGKHPDTPVVVDHFARIGIDGQIRPADVEALCQLAKRRHTFVKLSAFYALGKKEPPYLDMIPLIRRLLDAFGVNRLMWASDSPYQLGGVHTYAASIDVIRQHLDFLSDADRQWLLQRTAEQVFFW